MKTFRVAIAQINSTVGDIRGNGDKIIDFIALASKKSAELVIFPELTLTGYPPEDLLFKKSFIASNLKELKRVSKYTKNIYAVIGFADQQKGSIHNSAALIHDGKIKGVYNKILLPNYGVFDEKRYFLPGAKAQVFVVEGIRVGITICEDIWFKYGPAYFQSKKGKAEVILNLSSSPYHIGKLNERKKLISQVAKENGASVVYANLVGGQDELVFDGASLVASSDGNIISMGKQFEEDLIVVDLSIKKTNQKNKKIKNSKDSTTKDPCYQELKKLPIPVVKISALKKNVPMVSKLKITKTKPLQKMEEIFTALVTGVKDYVLKNGFKKALIGLSGGIDSALTAVIAADAIGSDNVIGVTMPSVYSSAGSVTDSKQLAENLGIKFIEIPIKNIVTVFEKELYQSIGGDLKGITEENIQSRIRGDLLMALSNNFNWLLLATGNKSEFSTGYCTLYGDMSGGFAVIKDVPKTLVFKLSEFRNKKAGFSLIPDSTLKKEPSAELRADQKDSDSLPPYPLLDEILQYYVEKDLDVLAITNKIKDRDIVRKVVTLVNRSEYKRRQGPPGVKITPRAFGKDRRYPIVNKFIEI